MPRRLVANGRELRSLRTKAKLTLLQAAAKTDLSESNIRRLEGEDAGARIDTLGRLADLYGVDLRKLTRWVKN